MSHDETEDGIDEVLAEDVVIEDSDALGRVKDREGVVPTARWQSTMSNEDPCSGELSAAVTAFTRRGTVEPGLDVEISAGTVEE